MPSRFRDLRGLSPAGLCPGRALLLFGPLPDSPDSFSIDRAFEALGTSVATRRVQTVFGFWAPRAETVLGLNGSLLRALEEVAGGLF